jgi:hypothetical protein
MRSIKKHIALGKGYPEKQREYENQQQLFGFICFPQYPFSSDSGCNENKR